VIAHVIPLRRFPRHLQLFDYVVPENLESSIAVGQLLQIPFRKSLLFGLVFDLSNETNDKLKEVDSIVCTTPIASKPYFEYIKNISERYATSFGHTANIGMLPLQKRKLSKLKLEPLQENNSQEIARNVSVYSLHNEHAEKLQSSINQNTLIVAPEIYLLDEVFECLTEEQKSNTVLWHSELSQKEKFQRWLQIRNSEKTIVLSTRSGMLLPFPKLDTIIVDYEHDENHKQWDGTPRIHVKDIVKENGKGKVLLIEHTGSKLCSMVGDQIVNQAFDNKWNGIITNGHIRDIEIIKDIDIGVYAKNSFPLKTDKSRGVGIINVPVTFGSININPDDWIYVDANGWVVSSSELKF